jgi:hypothetical protein
LLVFVAFTKKLSGTIIRDTFNNIVAFPSGSSRHVAAGTVPTLFMVQKSASPNRLEEERKKRLLDSIPERARTILSEYLTHP